jgi:hypothetical protein
MRRIRYPRSHAASQQILAPAIHPCFRASGWAQNPANSRAERSAAIRDSCGAVPASLVTTSSFSHPWDTGFRMALQHIPPSCIAFPPKLHRLLRDPNIHPINPNELPSHSKRFPGPTHEPPHASNHISADLATSLKSCAPHSGPLTPHPRAPQRCSKSLAPTSTSTKHAFTSLQLIPASPCSPSPSLSKPPAPL